MKRITRNYLYLGLMASVIILLDQVSKAFIRSNLAMGQMWVPWDWLMPYARIVRVGNTGVAFGMFQGMQPVLALLSLLVSIAIIYYYPRISQDDWTLRLALGLQLGGALGNLIDRIFFGHVTDFISVGTFPVFNVADSCITVGVIVLILGVYLQDRKNSQAGTGAGSDAISPEDSNINGKPLHCE